MLTTDLHNNQVSQYTRTYSTQRHCFILLSNVKFKCQIEIVARGRENELVYIEAKSIVGQIQDDQGAVHQNEPWYK